MMGGAVDEGVILLGEPSRTSGWGVNFDTSNCGSFFLTFIGGFAQDVFRFTVLS